MIIYHIGTVYFTYSIWFKGKRKKKRNFAYLSFGHAEKYASIKYYTQSNDIPNFYNFFRNLEVAYYDWCVIEIMFPVSHVKKEKNNNLSLILRNQDPIPMQY